MPVGFKNSTEGDDQGAVDSIAAAASAQVFPGVTEDGQVAIVSTCGNSECHLVLRGSSAGPNYDEEGVNDAQSRLVSAGVPIRVVVDASHGTAERIIAAGHWW
jgi:3-deoxy-7-phosphoheptulonate synthase